MASLSLSAKFFKLLCDADTDGLFGKAADLVKSDGVEPTERQLCDGLAVLRNKHPMAWWADSCVAVNAALTGRKVNGSHGFHMVDGRSGPTLVRAVKPWRWETSQKCEALLTKGA